MPWSTWTTRSPGSSLPTRSRVTTRLDGARRRMRVAPNSSRSVRTTSPSGSWANPPDSDPWTSPMAPGTGGSRNSATADVGMPASSSSSPMRLAWSVLITTRRLPISPIQPPSRSSRARQHGGGGVAGVRPAGVDERLGRTLPEAGERCARRHTGAASPAGAPPRRPGQLRRSCAWSSSAPASADSSSSSVSTRCADAGR